VPQDQNNQSQQKLHFEHSTTFCIRPYSMGAFNVLSPKQATFVQHISWPTMLSPCIQFSSSIEGFDRFDLTFMLNKITNQQFNFMSITKLLLE
jgi:hypothetical protein